MERCSVFLQAAIIYTSDGFLTTYFVYVSGEHISAAKAEVNALIHLSKSDVVLNWDGRIGLMDSQRNIIPFLLDRAALIKEAGVILAEVGVQNDLIESLSDDILKDNIDSDETFSVRTISTGDGASAAERLALESSLGAHISQAVGARVNLNHPKIRILVIFSKEHVRVCESFASKLRPMLRSREPGQKSFFHPSMMNTTLSRLMCNLAHVVPNEVVLDPFCGGGGILCEASFIGARTVGVDLNWRLLAGSKMNLSSVGNNYNVIQGDVRSLPVSACDSIVTDPPYGRSSSTRGAQAVKLVEALFGKVDSILRRRNESVCICGSHEMNLEDLAKGMGLIVNQVLQIRVHSGLVRELLTLSV